MRESLNKPKSVSKAKATFKEVVEFAAQLTKILTALSIFGLGIYAVYLSNGTTLVKEVALTVSGSCAILDGLFLLYKTIMRKQ